MGIIKNLIVFVQVECCLLVSNVILLIPQDEMMEMEIEVQMVLTVMVNIIPIYLLVDVVVPILPLVLVTLVLKDNPCGADLDSFSSQNLEGNVDMINILNNIINLYRV